MHPCTYPAKTATISLQIYLAFYYLTIFIYISVSSIAFPIQCAVSQHLGKDWKFLGRLLGLSVAEIEAIEVDSKYGIKDMAQTAINKWMEREGDQATTHTLIKHLELIGRKDIIQQM